MAKIRPFRAIRPVGMALYAEVVVGLHGEVGVSAVALQNALCQCYAGRDASAVHLGYRPFLIFGYILLTVHSLRRSLRKAQRGYKAEYYAHDR